MIYGNICVFLKLIITILVNGSYAEKMIENISLFCFATQNNPETSFTNTKRS